MAVFGGGAAEIGNWAGVGAGAGASAGAGAGTGAGVGAGAGARTGEGFALSTDVAIGGWTCKGVAAELSPALLLFGPTLESSISAARAFRLPRAARKLCTKDLRGTLWA